MQEQLNEECAQYDATVKSACIESMFWDIFKCWDREAAIKKSSANSKETSFIDYDASNCAFKIFTSLSLPILRFLHICAHTLCLPISWKLQPTPRSLNVKLNGKSFDLNVPLYSTLCAANAFAFLLLQLGSFVSAAKSSSFSCHITQLNLSKRNDEFAVD